MQLPFSKQLITAALIIILTPAATVIGAQSFSNFVSTPQPYFVAQVPTPPSGESSGLPTPTPPTPTPPRGEPSGLPMPTPSSGEPSDTPRCPPVLQVLCRPGTKESYVKTPEGCTVMKCVPENEQCHPPPTDLDCKEVDKLQNGCPKYDCRAKEGGWSCPTPPPDMRCEKVGEYPNGCVKFKCERVETPRPAPSSNPPELERCVREILGDSFERMLKGELPLGEEQKKLVSEKCQQFKRPGRGEGFDRAPDAQDGERRTCRINGVEMPGPCPKSSGPGGPMMSGPGGEEGSDMMGPGGFGPSEEDMERMEKEQKTRMLKDMKRGLKGMEQGLRMMERGISSCRKAKMNTAEPEAALAKIKEIIAKVKTAEDPDELIDIMQELPELFDGAREHVEACHRLAELPRITKQIGREIKQLEGEQRQLVSQVKRSKLDLADQLNEITAGIATVKEVLAEVNRIKTVDEFEAAMEKLEGLRETFGDLHEKIDAVRSVLNVKRAITDAKREIRNTERFISSLKRKKGVDTSELAEMVAAGKVFVAELETLAKQKPIDLDALHEQFELLMELGQRAEELMDQLRGKKTERGFEDRFGRSPVESVKLPDTFRQFEKEKDSEGPSELESLLGF